MGSLWPQATSNTFRLNHWLRLRSMFSYFAVSCAAWDGSFEKCKWLLPKRPLFPDCLRTATVCNRFDIGVFQTPVNRHVSRVVESRSVNLGCFSVTFHGKAISSLHRRKQKIENARTRALIHFALNINTERTSLNHQIAIEQRIIQRKSLSSSKRFKRK